MNNWTKENKSIRRTYHFDDFEQSMHFVGKVAGLAEKHNHHPDIVIEYDKVTLKLTTHDKGDTTEKDFELASLFDHIYKK